MSSHLIPHRGITGNWGERLFRQDVLGLSLSQTYFSGPANPLFGAFSRQGVLIPIAA